LGGSPTPATRARLWAVCMIALNLAGAAGLAVYMAIVERGGPTGALIAVFVVSVLMINLRAARKADSVGRRRMVRHGHLLLPEDFGAPDVRFTDRIETSQPKLGAPGSLN
jgi:hypothetical protein